MTDEHPDAQSQIDDCVAKLKSKIPPLEHGALDSKVEELLNDSSADEHDVISILLQEFDPEHNTSDRKAKSFSIKDIVSEDGALELVIGHLHTAPQELC